MTIMIIKVTLNGTTHVNSPTTISIPPTSGRPVIMSRMYSFTISTSKTGPQNNYIEHTGKGDGLQQWDASGIQWDDGGMLVGWSVIIW
jgi:hypothetical protein